MKKTRHEQKRIFSDNKRIFSDNIKDIKEDFHPASTASMTFVAAVIKRKAERRTEPCYHWHG